jgi:exodeoxyribonuclease-5
MTTTDLPASATRDLTDDQERALRSILNRVYNEYAHTKLNGKAGVGKTYVTGRLVQCLVTLDATPITVTAPTHEAANQLRSALPTEIEEVEVKTLHSALSLTMTWNRGSRVLTKATNRRGDWEPTTPRVLIVDESSMIGTKLAEYVEDMREKRQDINRPCSVIWIGDDGQLPPVNQKSAGVLEQPGPTLTEIVRQAEGSSIISAASVVRNAEDKWQTRVLDEVDGKEMRVTESGVREAAKAFRQTGELYGARVLAFRNDTVSKWNKRLVKELHSPDQEWEPGMRAMAEETWLGDYEDTMGPIYTSEMYEVVSASLKDRELGWFPEAGALKVPTWNLELDPAHREGTVHVQVIDSEAEAAYQKERNRRRDKAKKGTLPWQAFYSLVEDVADVGYGYASTVHKAQGATITDVFCDYGDIISAPGGEHQMQPLAYVAITRASNSFTFCI